MIKTRLAVIIQICENDYHYYYEPNSTTGKNYDGNNSDDVEFVTNNDSQSGWVLSESGIFWLRTIGIVDQSI